MVTKFDKLLGWVHSQYEFHFKDDKTHLDVYVTTDKFTQATLKDIGEMLGGELDWHTQMPQYSLAARGSDQLKQSIYR